MAKAPAPTTTTTSAGADDIKKVFADIIANTGSTATLTDDDVFQLISGGATGINPKLGVGTVYTAPYHSPDASTSLHNIDAFGDQQPGAGNPISINDATSKLISASKDQIQSLQQRLYDAGLYPDSYYTQKIDPKTGYPDDVTLKAFGQILQAATLEKRNGKTVDDVINERIQAFAPSLSKLANGGRFNTITVSDPAEIQSLADRIGPAVLGRKATPKEVEAITAAIQSHQADKQTAAMNAQDAGGRSYTTSEVNPTADVEQMLRQAHPDEAGANDFNNTMGDFFSLLGGISGGR